MTTMKDFLAVIITCYIFGGIVFGVVLTVKNREEGTDGCVYRSYSAYLFLTYIATCELGRARFNVEQPIQYIPKDNKQLK